MNELGKDGKVRQLHEMQQEGKETLPKEVDGGKWKVAAENLRVFPKQIINK